MTESLKLLHSNSDNVKNFDFCDIPLCTGNNVYSFKGANSDDTDDNELQCGENQKLDPVNKCCVPVDNEYEKSDEISYMDKAIDLFNKNPLIGVILGAQIIRYAVKAPSATCRAFKFLAATPEKFAELGKMGFKAGEIGVKTSVKVGSAIAKQGAIAATKTGLKAAQTGISHAISAIVTNVSKDAAKKSASALMKKLIPGPWAALDILMWGGMVLDAADPYNYGQYLDNQTGVLKMRDILESNYINNKTKDGGSGERLTDKQKKDGVERNAPPYLFTLDFLLHYDIYYPTEKDSRTLKINLKTLRESWTKISEIKEIYTKADQLYMADKVQNALEKVVEGATNGVKEDKEKMDTLVKVLNASLVQAAGGDADIEMPPWLGETIADEIGDNPIDRENFIINKLQNDFDGQETLSKYDENGEISADMGKKYNWNDFKDLIYISDPKKSVPGNTSPERKFMQENYGSAMTLGQKGKQHWDNVYKLCSNSMGFVVYTQYYRTAKYKGKGSKQEKDIYSREGVFWGKQGEETEDMSEEDMYDIKTEKLPIKWMLLAPTLETIKNMCSEGMHMPSMIYGITSLVNQKMCENRKYTYNSGYCSNSKFMDQPSCITNPDEKLTDAWKRGVFSDGWENGGGGTEGGTPNEISETAKSLGIKVVVSKDEDDIKNGRPGKSFIPGIWTEPVCSNDNSKKYTPAKCTIGTNVIEDVDQATCKYVHGEDRNSKKIDPKPVWTPADYILGVGSKSGEFADVITKLLNKLSTLNDSNDTNMFLNVKDVPPGEYDVTFNEDTGICNYTGKYCSRMGFHNKIEEIPFQTLHPDQKLTRCAGESPTDWIVEFICGETCSKQINEMEDKIENLVKVGEIATGNFLDDIGLTDKAGGTGTGSLSYAVDHPVERLGHDLGIDDNIGRTIDQTVLPAIGTVLPFLQVFPVFRSW